MDYKLEAMCLAATEIDAMRDFYAGVFDPDGNFMVFKQRKTAPAG